MRKGFLIITVFSIIALLFSCNTNKLKFQSDIESVIKKAKNNPGTLTEQEWKDADRRMKKFKEDFELNEYKMTEEERDKANELIDRYSHLRVPVLWEQIKSGVSEAEESIKEAMKELTDSTVK